MYERFFKFGMSFHTETDKAVGDSLLTTIQKATSKLNGAVVQRNQKIYTYTLLI